MGKFSFDGVESRQGGGGIEPGVYTARIREPRFAEADSGTTGFEVTFEAENGAGSVRDTQWVTAKTLPYLRYRLEAAGVELPSGEWEPSEKNRKFMTMVKSLEGCRVKILVRMEPDRKDPSKEWPRVAEWDKPDGRADDLAGKPSSDDDIPF